MLSDDVYDLIYKLTHMHIKLWVENDCLQLFVPEGQLLTAELYKQLRLQRDKIITVLKANDILNKHDRIGVLKSLTKISALSSNQQQLWFIDQYEGQSAHYNIGRAFLLKPNISLALLEKSLIQIIKKHSILRTKIKIDEAGQPYQHAFDSDDSFKILTQNVTDEKQLHDRIKCDHQYKFQLDKDYPLQVSCYQLETASSQRYVSIVFHHIAMDGWSLDIFFRQLQQNYIDLVKNVTSVYQGAIHQYIDYAIWENNYLKSTVFSKQLKLLKAQFKGYSNFNLPTDKRRPRFVDYVGSTLNFKLSEQETAALHTLANKLVVSVYSILLSSFFIFLRSVTGQADFVIGSVVANRNMQQVENTLGYFAHSIAYRSQVKIAQPVLDYIYEIYEAILEIQTNPIVPFSALLDALDITKDESRHPLFQVMFVLHNFNDNFSSDIFENEYQVFDMKRYAKFDLSLILFDQSPCLLGEFSYRTSLFDHKTIINFMESYCDILRKLLHHSAHNCVEKINVKISELLYSSQKNILMGKCVQSTDHHLLKYFNEQVLNTPDHIAVIDAASNIKFTYKQLYNDALTVALKLNQNLRANTMIAIYCEKSYLQPLIILAVWNISCAYLPLNTEWPIDRVQAVLEHAQISTIIVTSKYAHKFASLDRLYTIIVIDDLLQTKVMNQLLQSEPYDGNQLAYVIFTSGSTGKPKGVMISHQSVFNTIKAVNQRYAVKTGDAILAVSDLSFDLSVYDLFGMLLAGGTVVFPDPQRLFDPSHWLALIQQYSVTIWNTVPQLAHLLVNEMQLTHIQDELSLRLILLSGDWIHLPLAKQIRKIFCDAYLISLGGATECSIWSVWYEFNTVHEDWLSIPYGFAMPGQSLYILDIDNKVCAKGAVGELAIGGLGVAVGYLHDERQTRQKFIKHSQLGSLYKTGDLARLHSDGYIEFLGRTDQQIKINGYRIELDEIAHHLAKLPGITAALVNVHIINNVNQLIAYYTGGVYTDQYLAQQLSAELPDYMVPVFYYHLDQFPLTANGKIDRQNLPPICAQAISKIQTPRHDLDVQLCTIYSQLLSVEADVIGIDHDFFQLGGDSVLSIQLVSHIRHQLHYQITPKDVFQFKTIRELSDYMMTQHSSSQELIAEQGLLSGNIELLPIQAWFFTKQFAFPHHFNQAFVVKVPSLDITKLHTALQYLLQYHDALRLRFNDSCDAYYTNDYTFKFHEQAVTTLTEAQLQTNFAAWQSQFNINTGPLLCAAYSYGYADGSARIFFAAHHLVIDAMSWRIIIQDLRIIYEALHTNTPGTLENLLANKGTSYRQWSNYLYKYYAQNTEQYDYWKDILNDYNHAYSKNYLQYFNLSNYNSCEFFLDKCLTEQLLHSCHQAVHTQINDILLTALSYALCDFFKHQVNYICLEGHGRESINPAIDISRTVGWFTTLFPVRLTLAHQLDLIANVKIIKEMLRAIPERGLGYGAIIGYEKQSLPNILFNYLGQFTSERVANDWSFSNEVIAGTKASANDDDYMLKCNCYVHDGIFYMHLSGKLSQVTLKEFSDSFQKRLSSIVKALSESIKHEHTPCDFSSYESHILVNKHTDKPKLHILPPGAGGYECYLKQFSPRLNMSHSLYNNFHYFLHNEARVTLSPNISYSDLAISYIAHLKTICRHGPYQLFGWSFGAVLALEMTRYLTIMGDEVSDLFMVDPLFKIKETLHNLRIDFNNTQSIGALNYSFESKQLYSLPQTNIILFKATQRLSADLPKSDQEIFNYYATATRDNHLSSLIQANQFKVIELPANHFSWLNSEKSLSIVTDVINNNRIVC